MKLKPIYKKILKAINQGHVVEAFVFYKKSHLKHLSKVRIISNKDCEFIYVFNNGPNLQFYTSCFIQKSDSISKREDLTNEMMVYLMQEYDLAKQKIVHINVLK